MLSNCWSFPLFLTYFTLHPSFIPPPSISSFLPLFLKDPCKMKGSVPRPCLITVFRACKNLAAPQSFRERRMGERETRNSVGDYSSEDKPDYSHLALARQPGYKKDIFYSLQFNFNYSNLGEGTQEKPRHLCLGD